MVYKRAVSRSVLAWGKGRQIEHPQVYCYLLRREGLSNGSVVKNPPVNEGDMCSIPGLGRSPGGGNGIPLQYSCLGNHMDRSAWWATVHAVAKSQA